MAKKKGTTFVANAAKLKKLRDQARRMKSLKSTGLPGQITNDNRKKALKKLNRGRGKR